MQEYAETHDFDAVDRIKRRILSLYRDPLFWLSDAMIVNNCCNATEPGLGLRLNEDRTLLKCYMGDTGLLISPAFDENGIVSEEVYRKLLT